MGSAATPLLFLVALASMRIKQDMNLKQEDKS